MLWPSGKVYMSVPGLMFVLVMPGQASRASTWISLSKCPMLQTIAWSFILAMCSTVMTSRLPVAVT